MKQVQFHVIKNRNPNRDRMPPKALPAPHPGYVYMHIRATDELPGEDEIRAQIDAVFKKEGVQ